MGEVIGAEIYLTETIDPPIRYVAVSLVSAAGSLGGFAALAFAAYTTNFQVNWRIAFLDWGLHCPSWCSGVVA